MSNAIQTRSLLNFIALTIFATATAVFLVSKGNEAVAEIERLNDGPLKMHRAALAEQLDEAPDTSTSSTAFPSTNLGTSTAGWKTYRNEEYGFEVKFPFQWNEYKSEWYGVDYNVDFGQNDRYGFAITIASTTQTLEQYLKGKVVIFKGGPVTSIDWTKNITIGGLPAVQRGEFDNGGGWESIVTYVSRNGIMYELSKSGRYSGSFADNSTYDKILSTFKFTK